jgi:Flp pilus assembly protein TadG
MQPIQPAAKLCARSSSARRKRQRGSSLVEGALCFTVFLMILFGMIDFGRAVFAYNFISYAAREGARYAIVRGQSSGHAAIPSDVTSFVKQEAIGLDPSAITVNTTWTPDKNAGSTVQVQVQYSFQPIVPYMPSGPLNFSSTSKMLISQ